MSFKTRANIENVNPTKIYGKQKHKQPNGVKVKRNALAPIPQGLKRLKLRENHDQVVVEEEDKKVDEIPCVIAEVVKPGVGEIVLKSKQTFQFSKSLSDNCHIEREYIKDIWNYMKQFEMETVWPRVDYMRKQPHINSNMRGLLIDWLVQVALENKMNEQCVHLSVHYIDKFLSKMSVTKDKLQLLGAAAMMVAGKIEEIYPPLCQDWEFLTCESYTGIQIRTMEKLLLNVLNFDMQPPTILTFIKLLCSEHNFDNKTQYLSMYLAELMLLEGSDYLRHLPSELATASVALARLTLAKTEPWTKQLRDFSGYSLKTLSPVVQRQHKTFVDSPTKCEKAVLQKYQSPKFKRVATMKPVTLKLEDLDDEE